MNIKNFVVKDQDGKEVKLSDYVGKVVLVINTATECGFTPQYDDLQDIYDELKDKGFEVLDFPCNQFGGQAPGDDKEINNFCSLKFGTEFPRFTKIDVKGENADPLFKAMTEDKPFKGFDLNHEIGAILDKMLSADDKDYVKNPDIKWNFTKFLFNKDGELVERFEPTEDMKVVRKAIEELL